MTVGEAPFLRGDTDENAAVNLTDAVVILNHLFQGQPSSACLDALDTNDSGDVNLTDAVYLLQFLFQGGSPLPAPYPDAGQDLTADELERCTGA